MHKVRSVSKIFAVGGRNTMSRYGTESPHFSSIYYSKDMKYLSNLFTQFSSLDQELSIHSKFGTLSLFFICFLIKKSNTVIIGKKVTKHKDKWTLTAMINFYNFFSNCTLNIRTRAVKNVLFERVFVPGSLNLLKNRCYIWKIKNLK